MIHFVSFVYVVPFCVRTLNLASWTIQKLQNGVLSIVLNFAIRYRRETSRFTTLEGYGNSALVIQASFRASIRSMGADVFRQLRTPLLPRTPHQA